MDQTDPYYRLAVVAGCFSPGTPISQRSLFAGRSDQIGQGIDAVYQRGTHAIIFGERGVGKTSLANCLADFIPNPSQDESAEPRYLTARVNCTSSSSYESIWREVFSKIAITERFQGIGFGGTSSSHQVNFADSLPDPFGPSEVQQVLSLVTRAKRLIVTIDEFDKVSDVKTKTLMADTIKALSDHAVGATIMLVGIGDTVDELIAEHQSVARCLRQIQMPRMDFDEVRLVMRTGIQGYNARCTDFPLLASEDALTVVATLSRGMPHYAHLLAQQACIVALQEGEQTVGRDHVLNGTKRALAGIEQYVLSAYVKATTSSHKNALYRDVLTASAITPTDRLGFFPPGEVRKPLNSIVGRNIQMGTYMKHLNEFCTPGRGDVLQRQGDAWKCRFRFRDPLMQPYVVIQALGDGKLDLGALLQENS
jgi:energy-coupling factor transporter ATP-binding protein EcfA2